MDIKQDKGNPYIVPQYIKPKKSYQFKRQRNNHSLPSINGPFKEEKINAIRSQIDETKNQIITLKARINALKIQKERNQKKKQKHSNQINFIHTVRQRLYQDKKQKQDIQQRKDKQLQYLKQQANVMREKMIKDRELAKSMINQQKEAGAQQQRQKRKQDSDNIKRIKNIELTENQLKAKSIKQSQLQVQQKMKQFNQSRIAFSKQNHHQKVQKSLSEKLRLQNLVKKLKRQEEKMLEQCKKSQANMLNTLYQLQSLNPERKRRNSISSKGTTIKLN